MAEALCQDQGPTPAPAPQSAFYIGGSAGWGDTHWDNVFEFAELATIPGVGITSDSKDTGFAGRVYAGYDFNKYLAIEGGWTYLPKAKVHTTFIIPPMTASESFKIKQYAFDLVGKITAPLGDGLAVYAKGGVNYFRSKMGDIHISGTTPLGASSTTTVTGKAKFDHWGPVVGFGASYEIMPNLLAHVDWMRFSGDGKFFGDYQPNPDVIMAGLSYKFPIDLG